jgi:hypothetical protein
MELCDFIEYLEVSLIVIIVMFLPFNWYYLGWGALCFKMLFPLVYLRKYLLIMVCLDIVLYMHDLVVFQLVYVLQWSSCVKFAYVAFKMLYILRHALFPSHKLNYVIYSIGIFLWCNWYIMPRPRNVVIPSSSKDTRMCKVRVIQILDAQL